MTKQKFTKISCTFCALICLQLFITSASLRIIVIQPDEPSAKCPYQYCYTLTELTNCNQLYYKSRNCSHLFSSNTATAFLPGVYTYNSESSYVNTFFSVSHVTNIAFYAANASTGAVIKCKSNFALAFQDVINLIIAGLKFENCGAFDPTDDYFDEQVAVLISKSEKVYISNLTIIDGKQVGLMLMNVASATLSNLNLTNNHVNSYILAENEGRSIFDPLQNIHIKMTDSYLVSQRGQGSEQLILSQTRFEAIIQFTNITMIGGGLRITIESPSYSLIAIDHLTAENTDDVIYIQSSWDWWKFGNHRTSVTLSYSHFTNYKLTVEKKKGRPSENEKSMIAIFPRSN